MSDFDVDLEDDIETALEEAAQRRAGRLQVACVVIVACVWGDCILYGGWLGLWFGWVSGLFLAVVTHLIVGR